MLDKMKNLMEMKKQADRLKKELEKEITECNDVRGISIQINGAQMFQDVVIDESYLSPDKKNKLKVDLLRAMNLAIKKSQKQAAQKMQAMGGFPGM